MQRNIKAVAFWSVMGWSLVGGNMGLDRSYFMEIQELQQFIQSVAGMTVDVG